MHMHRREEQTFETCECKPFKQPFGWEDSESCEWKEKRDEFKEMQTYLMQMKQNTTANPNPIQMYHYSIAGLE